MVKRFELWLDESGDFANDSNTSKSPSLVGGVLTKEGTLSNTDIEKILKSDYVHSNEIKDNFGSYAIKVLSNINKHNAELVIFENKERLEIVDGSTTYLNILSEGIIQLLQLLTAKHGYIELEILKAVRLNVENQDTNPGELISQDNYINRLQERIIIGLARRTLSSNKNWSYSIKMGSARKDNRLMLADVVCNSYLTKNSRKFNNIQREHLSKLYKDTYCFTIFEKSTTAYIKRLLGEGLIGEAIFEIYTCEDNINKSELLEIVLDRLIMLDDAGSRAQLSNIKIRLGSLIKIDKDFKKSKKILIAIQEQFMPLLDSRRINTGFFAFDIYLYLLTVYTHEGEIELAEKQINLCTQEIKGLSNRWESIDYYFMFKIRQAIHDINTFNYILAISSMTELILSLEETLSLLPLVHGLGDIYKNIKSDLMGKALGTKLQAKTFIIRLNPEQLDRARVDSDRAIMEFMHISDITRQYQYRCAIECEGGNFVEALKYLCKSMNINYVHEDSLLELLSVINTKQQVIRLYAIMHYIRIMAESAIGENEDISRSMFDAFNKVNFYNDDIILKPNNNHPYEIIFWKLGTYNGKIGNIKAAMNYYNEAISICNNIPSRLTLRAIGLGIMAEKASVLGYSGDKYTREFNTALRDFINKYEQFQNNDLTISMSEYFKEWSDIINLLKESNNINGKSKILWEISRKITY